MIAIGDNVVDCYLDEQIYYPGGNAVNVAVGCKRYGFDEVAYIGVFGNDKEALHIQWALGRESITYEHSRYINAISGHPGVRHDEHGDRIFVGGPKNTAQHLVSIRLTEEDLTYIAGFDVAHSSCYSGFEAELPKLKGLCDVSFDFSNQHAHAYLNKVCPHIRFGFFSGSHMSDSQISDLFKQTADMGVEVAGVTLGDRGAIFRIGNEIHRQGIVKTKVIDTMGAGDSFIAGFLTSHFLGYTPRESLVRAAQHAANTCGFHGGFGYGRPFGT